ncbi:hypothetical protein Pint_34428 [Pistacia integerrima]|uniref:Uncharacterized protein n=1 Tax=Pistacia integerrima TaxID=434235 RepID=A0ACC0X768_9ROSI|nr:hypothetical protein Pint_34428 [Pistacia integerrima]
MMVLEDESGKEYETKYLAEKVGLSAGWRGFSIAHKLVERDVLVFHLVGPSKFKVYIVRSSGSDEVDVALGLLELETCYSRRDSVTFKKKGYAEKDINLCREKEDDNYWEPQPLAQAIPQVNSEKHNQMTGSCKLEPVSDQSEDSEVMDGIRLSESAVDFKEVKSVEDFNIVVNGLIINSTLSKHLRAKYYELCSSQNSFLHEGLLDGLNCRLAAGMISETINIADAIRASKITTSEGNFVIWDETLKAFKMMGMNVSFIQTRLDQLMNLASEPKRSKQARLERADADEEKRILEMKLLEVRETIKKLDAKIGTLGVNTDSLQVKFQEVATAPW